MFWPIAAHQIVSAGSTEPVTDSAWGFTPTDFLNYLQRTDQTPTRYERLRSGQPPGVTFWYRQSPPCTVDRLVRGRGDT
jgi:hypothetical protein